jgi:hypothetical protein
MPDLLDRALEAHGGSERFQSASEIVADIACGGFAFAMKFQRGALARFEGRISTGEPRSVLSPYPRSGQRGVMERGAVRIETDAGEVVAERSDPRPAFQGLRRQLWWDDLDLLYFAGYALWNYLTTPFCFMRPGFEVAEIEPWAEDGLRWRRLHARFPADVPTHSREQVFYFDEAGRLMRLDYTAEVFGSWAKAAHYCFDHERFDGILLPTRRRVFPRRRDNRPRPRPTLVWIEVSGVRLA